MIGILFDIQHAGRSSKPADAGAAFDLDGDGVIGENGEREVDLVRGYVAAGIAHAAELGIDTIVLSEGEYGARHEAAIRAARAHPDRRWAYLACHVNAGGGSYALVRPDHRSAGGADLARRVAASLDALPEISKGRVDPLYPTAQASGDPANAAWWTRGWSCIDGIYAGPANLRGVLVEPGFIDSKAHRPLWTPEGLVRVGRAIVDGVRAAG